MATPGARETGELDRCHRNYVETFWQYLRLIPGAARRDLPDATLIRCDLPFSLGNLLFFTHPESASVQRLLEARAFFGPRLPWRVIASGIRVPEVERATTAFGLRPGTNEPGMLLDPIPSIPPAPSSLTIRRVRDAEGLADFGTVWSEVFRIPRWVLPVALPGIPPDDPEHAVQNRFFVGSVDGRPVACSTLSVTEHVAGIASVGTIGSSRQRGFGTAMTWAAVDAGRSLGADVSYLAATPMGYPVYARMGFRRVAQYPSWHVPFGSFRVLGAMWTAWRLVQRQRTAHSRATHPGAGS